MFSFTPSSVYDSASLRQPRHYRPEARLSPSHAIDPRGRYLAALAEAEAAEAEYIAAIARDKTLQRQREEQEANDARREAAALQRQRTDALRRQAVLDDLHAHEHPYPSYDQYHTSLPVISPRHFSAQSQEEVLILRELERRRQRQREEKEAARIAAALEREKRERAEAKLRQQQAQLSQCSDEELLSLLSGHGRPAVHKTRSQASLHPAVINLLPTMAEPPHHQTPGAALRTPSRQAPNSDRRQADVSELMSALFGGLAEKKEEAKTLQPQCSRNVHFALQQRASSSCTSGATTASRSAPAPGSAPNNVASFMDILNGSNNETRNDIQHTLQSVFGPIFSENHASDENKASSPTPMPNAETTPPKPTAGPVPSTHPGSLKDHLRARPNKQSDVELHGTLQDLLGHIFNGASPSQRPAGTTSVPPAAPAPAPAPTSGLSLKEQLEARLHSGPNVEFHDTVRAVLASLMSAGAPAAASSSSAPTKADPSTSASASSAEGKGKGKSATTNPTSEPATTSPTSKDVLDAMNTIHSIEAHFSVLTSEFSFPTRLDFTPPSSRPSSPSVDSASLVNHLAYTSANAPVRYYEQALSALLGQLDGVDSYGNDDVRHARKEVVARVERTLEEVERDVRERFVQRQARDATAEAVEKAEVKEELENEELVEAEKVEEPVSVEESAVEESVADLIQLKGGATEPLAAPVADINTQGEELTTQVADANTSEELVSEEPIAATEHSSLSPDAFRLPSGIDSSIPCYVDDEATSSAVNEGAPVATESDAESLTSSIATVTPVASEAASATSASSDSPAPLPAAVASKPEVPESVDTFLLPNQPPIISKRPTSLNDEEELVVVDSHSETSEWSELDA